MALYQKDSNGNLVLLDSPFVCTADYMFPVGYVYIQLPNTQTPAELGLPGTWENISSNYAGYFFRFEGGSAAAFGSCQGFATCYDQLTIKSCAKCVSHCHKYSMCLKCGSGPVADNCTLKATTASAGCSNISCTGAHAHSAYLCNPTETRPANYTIRLWRRTA